jgi:hypothetical protein
MGGLPEAPFEVRLAVTAFLLLIGLANLFGAWEVRNFSAFTPAGVAATVGTPKHGAHDMGDMPVDLENIGRHSIDRQLLVQDSHVHIPSYAMIAAFVTLVIFGLRLSSRVRSILVAMAFGAPFLDFAGLWGAHLFPAVGTPLAAVAIAGGFLMGIIWLIVFLVSSNQMWMQRKETR